MNPNKGHPKDKAFRLLVALNNALEKQSRINWMATSRKCSRWKPDY